MSDKNKATEEAQENLNRASIATAGEMRHTAYQMAQRSHLSQFQIDEIIGDVSALVPAGNVPNMILSGLERMQNQGSQEEQVKKDIGMLFQGIGKMLDEASYRLLVHVPAQAILGYQKLWQLAGRNPEDAFPRGTWQFYVDYALREDTARHTNETDGFDKVLRDHNIVLSDVDRMTAWIMAVVYTLRQYDLLLKNEWRERVYTRRLMDLHDDPAYKQKVGNVWRKWLTTLPYRRMGDTRDHYPEYRRKFFDAFLKEYLDDLPPADRQAWQSQIVQAKAELLADYQEQMSILGYLEPETNSEIHRHVGIQSAKVAVVYNDCYYLFPVCRENSLRPIDVEEIRALVKRILESPAPYPPAGLTNFATVKREQWSNLRRRLPNDFVADLDALRLSPIILNFDPRDRRATLSEIRQAERGVGDNAMTIFDTRSSFCFDMSHIYFDGAWGAALAEIMTNEALSWANYLHHSSEPVAASSPPIALRFDAGKNVDKIVSSMRHTIPEIGAENDGIVLKKILQLRKYFKMRSDLLDLTVNDLMVLYRAYHGMQYQPDSQLVAELLALRGKNHTREAAESALDAIQQPERSPATLIPVDASPSSPRERLYPMTFEVPLEQLNLITLHNDVLNALNHLEKEDGSKRRFNQLQKDYLAALAGFGKVMTAAKDIAIAGESGSSKSIMMLAHIPPPLQRLLDTIPGRWDVLNDIIKGREVFSNVGRVAKNSTLRRFITAKDDNDKKTLAWGVITDADGVVRMSLRDFRPHVGLLIEANQPDLARRITQHYLDTYVDGFNQFIEDLTRITYKSPETTIGMRPVDNN